MNEVDGRGRKVGSEKLQKLGNLCSRERESMGENGSLLLMVFESRVNKYWLCNREKEQESDKPASQKKEYRLGTRCMS